MPFDELRATVYRGSVAFQSWRNAMVDNVGPTLVACGASSYDPKLECDFSASGGPKHCMMLFSEALLSEAIGVPPTTPEPYVHFLDSAGRRIEARRATTSSAGIPSWLEEMRHVMNVEPASDIAPGPAKVVIEQATDLAGNVSLLQSCDINIRP